MMDIKHDGKVAISIGASRRSTSWKNKELQWSELVDRLSHSQQTSELIEDYLRMTRDQQDNIKDIGGYVGGWLKDGKRKKENVDCRQLLTLDLDDAPDDLWDRIMDNVDLDAALLLYSTHKHRPGNARLRLIAPLSRRVTPDEYEALARKIAEKIGIDYCDHCTFQPSRLMYWPSHSADGETVFEVWDGPWLDPDSILAEYGGHWDDVSYWPKCGIEADLRKSDAKKQGDPTVKTGIVGAFCRTYNIPAAIAEFLPDVYTPTAKPDRYTYTSGSSSCGLVVYDGGLFAYSNHATDPASCQLCNAFDLVRLHLFGDLDTDPDLSGADTKSFQAMAEMAAADPAVKRILAADQKASAVLDFSSPLPPSGGDDSNDPADADEPPDMSWEDDLERKKNGDLVPSITNAILIISKHPDLAAIRYNDLEHICTVEGGVPWPRGDSEGSWTEMDESQLYAWIADLYKVHFPVSRYRMALDVAMSARRYNPLKDYLNGLPAWDGVERIGHLLVDYLGAKDTPYTAAVTRATLIGAVKRVYEPGCKHDTMLVIVGPTGIGKSTLISKLGGEFYSDSLSLQDVKDKTGAEKLQGRWLVEIGEMQGARKADIDNVKSFLSRQSDEYRPSYGHVVERRPRTVVIWGTTNNEDGFLRDVTGNRRYWPVHVSGGPLNVFDDLTPEVVAQVWAEAKAAYEVGELNYLDSAMEQEAALAQQEAMEPDDRDGLVMAYLDTPIPEDFFSWPSAKRADYYRQPEVFAAERERASAVRGFVSPVEIWVECFGKPLSRWERKNAYEIAAIMASIQGWKRGGDRVQIEGYGRQRVYRRV